MTVGPSGVAPLSVYERYRPQGAAAVPWHRLVIPPILVLMALVAWETVSRFGPPRLAQALVVGVLLAVIYAAYVGGLRIGLLAGVTASLGAFGHEMAAAGPGTRVEALVSSGVMTIAFVGSALLLGSLRTRTDRATARALDAERARVQALESKTRLLAQSNEALQSFAYVVSHDLKEPVRGMSVLLDALEEDHAEQLDAEGRTLLQQCRDSGERLAHLVQGLLHYSRATRAAFADQRPLDVAEVLTSPACTIMYDPLARERAAEIQIPPSGSDAPRVLAAEPALCQILGNLVINAIKHNPRPDPIIKVRAAPAGEGRVEVSVEDNGPGFPPWLVRRLNEARPEETLVTPSGGFGLAIVRRTTRLLGGDIEFGSAPAGGALVRVMLPAAPETTDRHS